MDKIDYDIDDLESLQNANIENQLLENQFLQGHENNLFNQTFLLNKHSLIYGFQIIKRECLIDEKNVYLDKQQNTFKIVNDYLSKQIDELKTELQDRIQSSEKLIEQYGNID